MASTNKTTNYELNQWLGNDYIKREDFNNDNELIDSALKANADAITSEAAARAAGDSALEDLVSSKLYAERVNGRDLNNILTEGFYSVSSGTVNAPLNIGGSLLVFPWVASTVDGSVGSAETVVTQMFISISINPRIFVRTNTDGTSSGWTDWKDSTYNSIATGVISIYVSPTGSDTTGDGTSSNPYNTWGKALSQIPKNLNGYYAQINIAPGTYNENVTIAGYFGGRILLALSGTVTVTSLASDYGSFVDCSSTVTLNVEWLYALRNGFIFFGSGVTVNVTGESTLGGLPNISVCSNAGSTIYMSGTVDISNNTGVCIYTGGGNSSVYIGTLTGSNNTGIGLRAYTGSTIKYGSSTLGASTATHTSSGGRIYSGAQTNIPNY